MPTYIRSPTSPRVPIRPRPCFFLDDPAKALGGDDTKKRGRRGYFGISLSDVNILLCAAGRAGATKRALYCQVQIFLYNHNLLLVLLPSLEESKVGVIKKREESLDPRKKRRGGRRRTQNVFL